MTIGTDPLSRNPAAAKFAQLLGAKDLRILELEALVEECGREIARLNARLKKFEPTPADPDIAQRIADAASKAATDGSPNGATTDGSTEQSGEPPEPA
jgi:hypothetical protein